MNSKQELFDEIDMHLAKDDNPQIYFNHLLDNPMMQESPFTLLSALKKVEQSPKHHPEGNVWNHTMLVVDQAAKVKMKSSSPRAFMWAALLHDIGKASTTRVQKGKITAYSHDKAGTPLAKSFLEQFTQDTSLITTVTALIRWHMQILYVTKSLPYADIVNMKAQVNLNDIALLSLCDRLGRVGADQKKEEENVRLFLEKVK